jgi:DNA-binding transcriptional MerR regulator
MNAGDDTPPDDVGPSDVGPDDFGPEDVALNVAPDIGPDDSRPRAKKAPNAFRTISEVADELHIPQHVLRFWETKFPQIKPLKRGGGRRYYRPDDILLLRRISDLLYIQGYTIKGVQRLLREGGGQLSEDIPPANATERAAAEVEQAAVPVKASFEPVSAAPAPGPDDAARLRAVLQETLDELVALRAMLN